MSVPEIGFRTLRASHNTLEKLGLGLVKNPPDPDPSSDTTVIAPLGLNIHLTDSVYVDAAKTIISGKLDIFALKQFQHGPDVNWNRDPLSGVVAPLIFGKTLDYRNSGVVGDIKYQWEPNRHLHLVTVAQAYKLTGDTKYLDFITDSIRSWITQCPYPLGPNWCSSLELAIRLINWSLVWRIVGGRKTFLEQESGERFLDEWLDSIYQHCHFIVTHFSGYSSAGNHLIGEAAGLYCAATVWNYWPACTEWRPRAKTILMTEALSQVHEDGVTKEQAIAYQQFVLDFLLVCGLLGHAAGDLYPAEFWHRIHAMIRFIAAIMDTGHHVPMLGDADDGFVFRLSADADFCPYRSLISTGASLFNDAFLESKRDDADKKTLWMLDMDFDTTNIDSSHYPAGVPDSFPSGGYYILGTGLDTPDEVRLLMDAGPLGLSGIAGHGHADALSMMLNVGGHEILIDPGTYAYHTKRKMRDYFRGTSAHNTIRIDGEDQSVSGGTFMWIKHATAHCISRETTPDTDTLVAEHDGYGRLKPPATHQRRIELSRADKRITVTDSITSSGPHTIEMFWHVSENCTVDLDDRTVRILTGAIEVTLSCHDESATMSLARGDSYTPLGWVSRSFDVKTPTTTIVIKLKTENNRSVETLIEVKTP